MQNRGKLGRKESQSFCLITFTSAQFNAKIMQKDKRLGRKGVTDANF